MRTDAARYPDLDFARAYRGYRDDPRTLSSFGATGEHPLVRARRYYGAEGCCGLHRHTMTLTQARDLWKARMSVERQECEASKYARERLRRQAHRERLLRARQDRRQRMGVAA